MSECVDSTAETLDRAPLWKFITKLEKEKDGKGGGNTPFKCNICNREYNGSYYRVKHHLLKIPGKGISICPKASPAQVAMFEKMQAEAESKAKRAQPREVPLPSSATSRLVTSSIGTTTSMYPFDAGKKRKGPDVTLEKAFNNEAREMVREEIARMFYTGGLSFNRARNPHYKQAFSLLANRPIPGFVPPGYNSLRTTLLKKERSNIERQLEPIKAAWPTKGVSVCSDGWSDSQRRPLINLMAVSDGGPMFIRAVNCEGEFKGKEFIADLLTETIREIGPKNVVQVITDNAANCKGAGYIVEGRFPHIFWTPCVVHTLNLALKNICAPSCHATNETAWEQCSWISEISSHASFIKVFIMNHNMRLSMFNECSDLKLLSVADTRFASIIVMLRRFKQIKQALQMMVISEPWDLYKEDDVGKARTVKEKILDDNFWDQVDYILSFTDPIYEMLRKADTDMPCLHLVYEWWDSMIEKVKLSIYNHEGKELTERSEFYDVVHDILVARWNKSNTPLHCLAHSLNPKYYSDEWLAEVPGRVAPHKDVEISSMRKKCIERYFPNDVERRSVNTEFGMFSSSLGEFACGDAMKDRAHLQPQVWWACHGATAPNLLFLANRLLGQPCSSSCCERNWSTYNFIHSVQRNKIVPQRAENLVFVHYNLRLMSRKSSQYKVGESKMWDVGGDIGNESLSGIKVKKLHSLILRQSKPIFSELLFQMTRLRSLDLRSSRLEKLPDEVEILLHLWYLDLSYTPLKELPETMSNLYNLQSLKLISCEFLSRLPGRIGRLVNLRHVECCHSSYFPQGFGKLKHLRTLLKFVVSNASGGCKLEELKDLNLISGELKITGLRQVENIDAAKSAELQTNENIVSLTLDFSEVSEQVITSEENEK